MYDIINFILYIVHINNNYFQDFFITPFYNNISVLIIILLRNLRHATVNNMYDKFCFNFPSLPVRRFFPL